MFRAMVHVMSAKNAECVLANQDEKRAAESATPANKKTSNLDKKTKPRCVPLLL